MTSTQRSTAKAQLPPSSGSPPDKPLPSLPITTLVSETRSPVQRRSLIDATDKPLRRSMSPSRTAERDEEWPALKPFHAKSHEALLVTDPEKLTAMGKSSNIKHEPNVHDYNNAITKEDESTTMTSIEDSKHRELEARPDTPSGSDNHHKRQSIGPIIRQTKTSAMRAQRAFEGSQFRNRQPSEAVSALDSSRASSAASSRSPTPTLDTFRGIRQGVTAKGSPYTLKISDLAVRDVSLPTVKPDKKVGAANRRRPDSSGSIGSESLSELVAVKENRPDLKRNRSILETLQSTHADLHPESEGDVPHIATSKRSKAWKDEGNTSDADFDTDIDKTARAVAELAIREDKSAKVEDLAEKSSEVASEEPDMAFIRSLREEPEVYGMSPDYIVRRLSRVCA